MRFVVMPLFKNSKSPKVFCVVDTMTNKVLFRTDLKLANKLCNDFNNRNSFKFN